jgi:hypothetical protein
MMPGHLRFCILFIISITELENESQSQGLIKEPHFSHYWYRSGRGSNPSRLSSTQPFSVAITLVFWMDRVDEQRTVCSNRMQIQCAVKRNMHAFFMCLMTAFFRLSIFIESTLKTRTNSAHKISSSNLPIKSAHQICPSNLPIENACVSYFLSCEIL